MRRHLLALFLAIAVAPAVEVRPTVEVKLGFDEKVTKVGQVGLRIDAVKNKPHDSYCVIGTLIPLAKKRYLAEVKAWAEQCGGKTVDDVWAECVLLKTK